MPALGAPATAGYFTKGDPLSATPATVPGQDWCNSVQEEIVGVIIGAGIALDKSNVNQLKLAVLALIASAVPPTREVIAAGAVAIGLTDAVVGLNKTVPATTAVTLPSGAAIGQVFRLEDWKGNASGFNATVTPPGGMTINGQATYIMAQDFQGVTFRFIGTNRYVAI